MFNAFEELFAPSRKHTHEEQNRLELTREDVGDTDPGRGPIDLASGKVVVRPRTAPPPEEEAAEGKAAEAEAGGAMEGRTAQEAAAEGD
ncbi:DUF6191 domain-containing protein [Streptomyces broussonetiae]|uniref:Regulatory protein n=1 Tax=Streptomyces broussonetiae TaxID=2686304 RepID=A0A6I6N8M0_9ACTN|nr:DUF6191 domain-containing protein [Streptomyces broussonetiae]QHA07009.1 hypothetical protein GQF42_30235 [Streptomyces broussonetiae]